MDKLQYRDVVKLLEASDLKKPEEVSHLLTFTAALDKVEQARLLLQLTERKGEHGLSKSELKAEVAQRMRNGPSAFFDGTKLKPIRVVQALMQARHYLTTAHDKQLRLYKNGVYVPDTTQETDRHIMELLGDEVTAHAMDGVIRLLQAQTMQEVDRHKNWINLANGRWCLDTWKLLEHSPKELSLIQLPVAYDPEATCPVFDNWLADVLPNSDDQWLLLQLIGYSMLQDVRFGKIAVLYGPTHTGKSTCLEIVKAFLGADNVSAISLHALDNEDRRFTRSGLVEKLANLSADLSHKYLAGDSQVKQIAVGDPMQVEYKGVQGFSYSPCATLWASCNQLPGTHDRSEAMMQRLMIIPFLNQHIGKQADRTLLDRLTQPSELSGILNHALGALRILLTDNAFRETAMTTEMLAQYRLANNHVERFLDERYSKQADGQETESEVYQDYQTWCEGEGIKPLSKTKLRQGITTWLGTKRIRQGTVRREFVWVGLSQIAQK